MGKRISKQGGMAVIARAQYIIIALLAIIITVIGFWENYFGPLFKGTLDTHWAIDVHAAIFVLWLILFLGQAILAYKKKIDWHITTGTYVGIFLGVLLLVIGLSITFAVIIPGIGRDHTVDNYVISLNGSLVNIITFGIFFLAAIIYRKRADYHKRLIVLATVALLGAPLARLGIVGSILDFGIPLFVAVTPFITLRLLPLLIAMAYDKWIEAKIHRVYWIGLGILLLNFSSLFWRSSETWRAIANWITRSMKPVMESIF